MITIETKLGDMVQNGYGETGRIVGLSPQGLFWRVRNESSGRETLARVITADTVVIVGLPIEGGN